jgi:tRNA/rRNA methyltransferase
MKLENLHLILVRTQSPQNLGAVARLMRNFGLTRLTLVDRLTRDLDTARRVAVRAEDLIDGLAEVATLPEALGGARWVVGTSGRAGTGQRLLPPRAFAAEAAARTDEGEVALVFGGEQHGLTNDDLLRCHDVSAIPTGPDQPSLNLAQAALVYAYEVFHAGSPAETGLAPRGEARAPEGQLQQVEHALRTLLGQSKFADLDRPGHGVRELAHVLRRGAPTETEARLWLAALRLAIRAGAEKKDEIDL